MIAATSGLGSSSESARRFAIRHIERPTPAA